MKNNFKPAVTSTVRGDCGGVLGAEVLAIKRTRRCPTPAPGISSTRMRLQSAERGDVYAHANAHGNSPAHGAVRLPRIRSRWSADAGWQQFFAKLEEVLARQTTTLRFVVSNQRRPH